MDCSLPCSSAHGIFQARVLEWVAISFSRGSSQPRDWTRVSHIVGRRFTILATREEVSFTLHNWRRKWQPTAAILPGEFHRERSLMGYSPWGLKDSDMTKWLTHAYTHTIKFILMRTSLEVQWLRLCMPTAGGIGSIPGGGPKIPHAL